MNTVQQAIEEIKKGRLVLLVDDEKRENEADLVCAAEFITPETVNFMAKFGRNGRFMQDALELFDYKALTYFFKEIGVEQDRPLATEPMAFFVYKGIQKE